MKTIQRQINKKTIIIWRFIDGKVGHEKQSAALIFELEKLIPVKVFEFHSNTMDIFRDLFLGRRKFSKYHNSKKPDLIIGTGHRTHIPMLLAKLKFGGKTVVIMKPSLPYSFFDLCLVPDHDKPIKRNNIIPIIGALNKISYDKPPPKEVGLYTLLIGGPSSHYKWTNHEIIDQIENFANSTKKKNLRYILSTSRRTPKDFIHDLTQRHIENLEVYNYEETQDGWVDNVLLKSEYALITPDSISMIYEAFSANCNVGIFKLETVSKKDKLYREVLLLKERNLIIELDFIQKGLAKNDNKMKNYTKFCATEIIKKFLN